jgi:hypothetical protein
MQFQDYVRRRGGGNIGNTGNHLHSKIKKTGFQEKLRVIVGGREDSCE